MSVQHELPGPSHKLNAPPIERAAMVADKAATFIVVSFAKTTNHEINENKTHLCSNKTLEYV